MLETLIVYDETGYVFYQASGDVREPIGIPFLKVTIPSGKFVSRVDVSGETPTAIFEDFPKSEVELLKEQQDMMQKALDELIFGGAL